MARPLEPGSTDGQSTARGKSWVVMIPIVFLLMGLWICLEAMQLPLGSVRMPAAGFFPLLLGVMLSLLSLVLFASGLLTDPLGSSEVMSPRPEIVMLIGAIFASAWLFERAGYLLTMIVFLVVVLKTLGQLRWITSVALAGLGSIASYLLFDRVLMIALPSGILPF
jgi:putative tricarboxylic transport membrane protein